MSEQKIVSVNILETNFDKVTGVATAQVEFVNPWAEENPAVNVNKTKTINVPIDSATGKILEEEWMERLGHQANAQSGFMQRTADSARAASKSSAINSELNKISGKSIAIDLNKPMTTPEPDPAATPDAPPASVEDASTEASAGSAKNKKSNL